MRVKISNRNLRSNFVKKIEEISGQNIFSCYQCGKCSAGCPSADRADITPSAVIRLIQLGQEEKALNSNVIWYCATCFTCDVRCPRGVDLSRIMEALRLMKLRKGVNHVEPSKMTRKKLAEFPQIALVSNFRKLTSY